MGQVIERFMLHEIDVLEEKLKQDEEYRGNSPVLQALRVQLIAGETTIWKLRRSIGSTYPSGTDPGFLNLDLAGNNTSPLMRPLRKED